MNWNGPAECMFWAEGGATLQVFTNIMMRQWYLFRLHYLNLPRILHALGAWLVYCRLAVVKSIDWNPIIPSIFRNMSLTGVWSAMRPFLHFHILLPCRAK